MRYQVEYHYGEPTRRSIWRRAVNGVFDDRRDAKDAADRLRDHNPGTYARVVPLDQSTGMYAPTNIPDTTHSGFRVLYFEGGKRAVASTYEATVDSARRYMNDLKSRGMTAWVEKHDGEFVPVRGSSRYVAAFESPKPPPPKPKKPRASRPSKPKKRSALSTADQIKLAERALRGKP